MKIVVDVVNSEKVKELTAEIQKQEKQIVAWNAAMKTAGSTQEAVLKKNMSGAGQLIAAAKEEIVKLGGATSKSSQNLSQLSYAIDDIQYGFNAIVNNIPGIVMGLGGSAGIAGAAGIAAVAINQLIKHAGDLADAFEAWRSNRPAEILAEIRAEAEAAAAALEKLSKFTEEQERRAGMAGKFVQNQPKERFIAEVADALEVDEKKLERYRKYYEAKSSIGLVKGLESKDERDLRLLRAEASAKKAEEDERRERAEKLVGKALLPGRAGQQGLADLQSLLPGRDKELADLAKGIEPGQMGQQARKRDEVAKAAHDKDEAATRERILKEAEAKKKARDEQKKDDAEERREWLADIAKIHKEKKLEGLEGEREAVLKAQREFDEGMWKRSHMAGETAQIMQGSRAATDYYQTGGREDQKKIAEEAHRQREKTIKLLEGIHEEEKKARRVIIPH